MCLNCQHGGLNVFSHQLALHDLGANNSCWHEGGVLREDCPEVLEEVYYACFYPFLEYARPDSIAFTRIKTLVED